MTPQEFRTERTARGWSQNRVARILGVSQPYVVMLEKGKRPLTDKLVRKFVSASHSSAAFLPTPKVVDPQHLDAQTMAENLAQLGYPGYAYLRSRRVKKNPSEVLLTGLAQNNLEARLVEALPWLVLRYWDMDFNWLVVEAKKRDLQNRFGFLVNLARRMSERTYNAARTNKLMEFEDVLNKSRLVREDYFLRPARNDVERDWMLQNRTNDAQHWNLVTDLRPEHLAYNE